MLSFEVDDLAEKLNGVTGYLKPLIFGNVRMFVLVC